MIKKLGFVLVSKFSQRVFSFAYLSFTNLRFIFLYTNTHFFFAKKKCTSEEKIAAATEILTTIQTNPLLFPSHTFTHTNKSYIVLKSELKL